VKYITTSTGDTVTVSDTDFKLVSSLNWSTLRSKNHALKYARRTFPGKRHVFMHRYILGIKDTAVVVDHKNRDGLDNRRCNLRVGSRSQNLYNSKLRSNNRSGYKGVSWNKWHKAWMVKIRAENKYVFLGYFSDKVTGAKRYDAEAKKLFGKFARLNFP
jgi:HNH endonuclease